MKVILHLTNTEATELVNNTTGTAIEKQVKMAVFQAETKELRKAIRLEKTGSTDNELNAIEAELAKAK